MPTYPEFSLLIRVRQPKQKEIVLHQQYPNLPPVLEVLPNPCFVNLDKVA